MMRYNRSRHHRRQRVAEFALALTLVVGMPGGEAVAPRLRRLHSRSGSGGVCQPGDALCCADAATARRAHARPCHACCRQRPAITRDRRRVDRQGERWRTCRRFCWCGCCWGGGAPAAAIAAPVAAAASPSHLAWKVGERCKYDKAVVFECPAISGLTAEQLARKVFRGALREQAAAFPHIEQQFVDAASENFLIEMNVTCGVVSPADVAEQLMSRRATVSNTNLLCLVAVWVKKYVDENVAALEVLEVSLEGESTWDAELAVSASRRRDQLEGGTGCAPAASGVGKRSVSGNDVDDEDDGEEDGFGKDDDGDSWDEEEVSMRV
eukprot:TRINITY_DN11689_c0_g1_i1.p1 TRINITY_DN11689_c0_g1~~TRINITY_DN11689_c0_g1_i1.p1  ORF type:complete len:324 (+),score=32.94 TRINITY_DN11689_c0_g1_i1:1275-2246(+)